MDRTNTVILLALFALLILTPMMRTTPSVYSSDTASYYMVVDEMVDTSGISRDEPFRGLVNRSGQFFSATPIGYSLLSMPTAWLVGSGMQDDTWMDFEPGPGIERNWHQDLLTADYLLSYHGSFHVSRNDGFGGVNLSGRIRGFPANRTVWIRHNGREVKEITVDDSYEHFHIATETYFPEANFTFHADGCSPLADFYPGTDSYRCTGMLMQDVSGWSIRTYNPSFVTHDGSWGTPQTRLLQDTHNYTISTYNEDLALERRIQFDAWSIDPETTITGQAWYNGTVVASFEREIINATETILTPRIPLRNQTTLQLSVDQDGCDEAPCTEAGVSGLRVLEQGTVGGERYRLDGDWYRRNPWTENRWTHGPVTIVTDGVEELSFSMRVFGDDQTINVTGTERRILGASSQWQTITFELEQDRERVRLTPSQPCQRPIRVLEDSDDPRCLSFAVTDLTLR